MRKALLVFLLLGSLLVLTFAVTGCESTGTITPTATSQFAFLRYVGGVFAPAARSGNLGGYAPLAKHSTTFKAAVPGKRTSIPAALMSTSWTSTARLAVKSG